MGLTSCFACKQQYVIAGLLIIAWLLEYILVLLMELFVVEKIRLIYIPVILQVYVFIQWYKGGTWREPSNTAKLALRSQASVSLLG